MTPLDIRPGEIEEAVLVLSGSNRRDNGHAQAEAPPPGSIGDLIDRYNAAERRAVKAREEREDAENVLTATRRRLYDALQNRQAGVVHGGKVYLPGGGFRVECHDLTPAFTMADPPRTDEM